MFYAETLWLFFLLVFAIIAVPGMDMLFVIAHSLTGGRRAGLTATAGIMLGGVAHTIIGATLVGLILEFAPFLFTAMLYVGVAYMIWIGIQLLRSSITVDPERASKRRSLVSIFRQGLVTCLLNPKAYFFVFSVYPQFLKPQFGAFWIQATAMGVITVATQFAIYGGLAVAAAKSRDFLQDNHGATIFVGRAAGLLLIGAAIASLLW